MKSLPNFVKIHHCLWYHPMLEMIGFLTLRGDPNNKINAIVAALCFHRLKILHFSQIEKLFPFHRLKILHFSQFENFYDFPCKIFGK